MTFFCPAYWSEIGPSDSSCPTCGADFRKMDAQSFVERLRAALRHPEPQTAVGAAWILGEHREKLAMADLIGVLENTKDGFLVEAAAEALGKIGDPPALAALEQVSRLGTVRVRNASKQAIDRIQDKQDEPSSVERES